MCRSKKDGGQRCFPHARNKLRTARQRLDRTEPGTEEHTAARTALSEAEIDYASTVRGRKDLDEQALNCERDGQPEQAQALRDIIELGRTRQIERRAAAPTPPPSPGPDRFLTDHALALRDIPAGPHSPANARALIHLLDSEIHPPAHRGQPALVHVTTADELDVHCRKMSYVLTRLGVINDRLDANCSDLRHNMLVVRLAIGNLVRATTKNVPADAGPAEYWVRAQRLSDDTHALLNMLSEEIATANPR